MPYAIDPKLYAANHTFSVEQLNGPKKSDKTLYNIWQTQARGRIK